MKRTNRESLRIGTEQAARALHILVSEGKVAAQDIWAALKREKLIGELRKRLADLGADGFRVAQKSRRPVKRRLSAARRAAMKVQGKYMAAVRRLPKATRAKIKAIREKSGVKAAIAAARRMVSR